MVEQKKRQKAPRRAMSSRKTYYVFGVLFIGLVTLTIVIKPSGQPVFSSAEVRVPNAWTSPSLAEDWETAVDDRPSFLEIATRLGRGEANSHHYHHMYEKYLEPIRDRKLRVLEIGLGPETSWGPGASFYTWLEFFHDVEIYIIEHDIERAEKWPQNISHVTILPGDPGNTIFLHDLIKTTHGAFDIIIDTGIAHSIQQQRVALRTLFYTLVPGGLYFSEDLARRGGHGEESMMDVVKGLLDELNHGGEGRVVKRDVLGKLMRSIECGEGICVFVKR